MISVGHTRNQSDRQRNAQFNFDAALVITEQAVELSLHSDLGLGLDRRPLGFPFAHIDLYGVKRIFL